MKTHLNTLFVTTPGAYLRKDGAAVAVSVQRVVKLRVPLHHLDGIIALGAVGASPALLAACAREGIAFSFLSRHGQFLARVAGFTSGNVLLRRAQYRLADDPGAALGIARMFVLGKIANVRQVLLRAARDHPDGPDRGKLENVAGRLAASLDQVERAETVDVLRGVEGESARDYFSVFNCLITAKDEGFEMTGRSRRPPLDPVNSLLSFVYALLTHDARSACESVGLDSAVGFLHADRPGRPGLALDLMEEFRPFLADRLVLSLMNRRQVRVSGFIRQESGAVLMDDATRKTVLVAYQKRKQETVTHPFLNESVTVGILVHLQARLLARHLRGEMEAYPPFLAK